MSECLGMDHVAMDTEFIRFNTFYPIFGLLQISDGETNYLVDPLTVKDLSSLKKLMESETVVKVLHSCSEDLEVFVRYLDCVPRPLHDTQLAAGILGQGFSMSYQALVARLTGDHLPKDETRSDWLQRPLSEAQTRYAALDVAYLPRIFEQQTAELQEKDRQAWAAEETEQMLSNVFENSDIENYYLRVKSAWKLEAKELNLLKQLCVWREQEARDRDIPRNRIIADKLLYGLARSGAKGNAEFDQSGLSKGQIRRYGETLIQLIQMANQMDVTKWPEVLERPVASESRDLLKKLKIRVDERAEQLGCAAEILAKKKQLEALLRCKDANGRYRLPSDFQGWRKTVIGELLLDDLNS